MTDKIIIDGVDVSGCRFYDGEFEYSCQCSCTICERNQEDCYYKQLKTKEQECEKLKEEVSLLKESNSKLQPIEDVGSLEKCYLQQLDQLKAENKELKNFHINLVGVKECEIKELVKYKQALTEIKEIAYELTNEEYTDFIKCKQEQILQKCEVINEHN